MAKDTRLSPVLKRVLVGIAAVVGLALLIFGVSAISSTRKPAAETTASTTQLSDEAQAEQLANQALTAASNAETDTARTLAKSALKLNAANQTALSVIAKLDEAAKQSSAATLQPAPSNTTTSAPVDQWLKSAAKLSAFLPSKIVGWSAGSVVAQGADAQVTFSPESDSEDDGSAIRATFSVHDRGSVAKAGRFVSAVDKKVYPGDGTVATFGTQRGYFGTDGARLAVAVFARGRFVFEVVVYSREGIKPSTLLTLATKLASAFPAAR